ncbi:MAG: response regulator transcription factor [Prevotella sp.]|nr:response regulator transcription factor [Prevotella sp.]
MRKTPVKAIVVDDERLPRLALLQKLEEFHQQVEVVDSCDNYGDALKSILHHRPQLLFLDIQLSGKNAMQLLDELKEAMPLPHVIFTTAYDNREYLMKAIKLQAVDYLIKPIDPGELALAIGKVTGSRQTHDRPMKSPESHNGKCLMRTTNGQVFVTIDDILYIHADGNYSVVVTLHDQVMVLESLISIERRLNSDIFCRADRRNLVNKRHVYKINSRNSTCVFLTDNGENIDLNLSKNGIETLLQAMSE